MERKEILPRTSQEVTVGLKDFSVMIKPECTEQLLPNLSMCLKSVSLKIHVLPHKILNASAPYSPISLIRTRKT